MKKIKISFWGLFFALSLLWAWADPVWLEPYRFFGLRVVLINYTGILAIGVMSVAMILAARPAGVERLLGGLDKMYRLHKWLGIAGLVLGCAHWLWVQIPKWLVGWGLLVRPARRAAAGQSARLLQFFQEQRRLAESLGEWAFYLAVALIILALVKCVPYRLFLKVHRFLALVYLCLVFHSLVLMRFVYWNGLLGPLMAVLMLAGSVAALVCLFGRAGQGRRSHGNIEALTYYPDCQVLRVDLCGCERWPGHKAGQFAFVTFDGSEGAHPFSLSSCWHADGRLSFHIKSLGDYTRQLPQHLACGARVLLEGPYGCFDFSGRKSRQIWVAGGIGIAPFMSRLDELALVPDSRPVHLFYGTRQPDDALIVQLEQKAQAAGVELHVLIEAKDGRLDAERLCAWVPEWRSAEVWFCGPEAFARSLSAGLLAKGLPAADFHRELFEMR